MAVKHEIKSQLAKLLATEDIIVEHKMVPSAQFNVQTRVLILPLWEKASNDVYDMLVGHEVGHALFTPDEEWWLDYDVPQNIVNVVEDARIEKLMKRKYLGIAKSFYKGYTELHHQDFFELNGEDVITFNLADRANLYFKIGSILPVSFSTPEKEIIDLISNAETFTDTLSAAEALYNFCKQEQEKESLENEQQAKVDFEQDFETVGNLDTGGTDDSGTSLPDTDSSSSMEDRSDNASGTDWMDDSDPFVGDVEVKTADALDSKLKDLIDSDGVENTYVEIPNVNLDTIIATNEDVHREIDDSYELQQKMVYDRNLDGNIFEEVDETFHTFKRDAQKEVNYLVKEFECRKAATSYARTATSRTGVLDTAKLHTYRYNEDLFKKITTVPDGKNHGLIFILDWSGSMQYVLEDTLKQLYNLIWFCKKVQIPFEVYAFTNEWLNRHQHPNELIPHYEEKEGLFKVESDFCLMNLFTSKVNKATLQHQMINIWRIAKCFGKSFYCYYTYPQRLCLSGTPLNESIITLHQLIPHFQKVNDVEKVQCIVLTDGEANSIPYSKVVHRSWESEPYMGARSANPNHTFLRDRKIGKTYKFGYRWHQFTDVLLRNLKDRFPSTNFIGIRVLGKRDASQFMRMHNADEKVFSDWRKNKSFVLKDSGYDAYFGISGTVLAQDADFDVDYGATKAQVKRAFVKSLKTKKLNKKVLGEFISLVA